MEGGKKLLKSSDCCVRTLWHSTLRYTQNHLFLKCHFLPHWLNLHSSLSKMASVPSLSGHTDDLVCPKACFPSSKLEAEIRMASLSQGLTRYVFYMHSMDTITTFLCTWDRISVSLGWPQIYYVAEFGLEPLVLWPAPLYSAFIIPILKRREWGPGKLSHSLRHTVKGRSQDQNFGICPPAPPHAMLLPLVACNANVFLRAVCLFPPNTNFKKTL